MKVNGKDYRTVWMQNHKVYLINQSLLPFEFKINESETVDDTCRAIKTMIVRGAGAIGAAAGFAMAQAFLEAPQSPDRDFWSYAKRAKRKIESTRPTAQNLAYATNRVYDSARKSENPTVTAIQESKKIADEDAEASRKIGEHGEKLIGNGFKIQTHCNAGWLAFVDYGTALSPIYMANRNGKEVFVYVDETRPRNQGAKLTAWELKNEGIRHVIVPDSAGAYLMSDKEKRPDLIIVGADRIARNGDVANKIGTLEKAIVAQKYEIPFYVAAPISTIDLNCKSGANIPIEEREQEEVTYQVGLTTEGKLEKLLISSPGSLAINPAFDVTPAELVTGIITEKRIIRADEKEILGLFL